MGVSPTVALVLMSWNGWSGMVLVMAIGKQRLTTVEWNGNRMNMEWGLMEWSSFPSYP